MEENQFPQDDPISYFKSNIINEEERNFNSIFLGYPKPSTTSLWNLFSIVLGLYFVFSIFFCNILLRPMTVEGASMYPTLNDEYTTTGNKYATDVVYLWKTQDVEYKDVVVFNSSPYTENNAGITYYIKRVIAIAGDTIQFKKVQPQNTSHPTYILIKNGETLVEDYIAETMSYYSESIAPEFIKKEATITVPEGHVFVMGDNRNNSRDSRDLGFISLEDIVGRVILHIPYGQTIIHGIVHSIKEDYLF